MAKNLARNIGFLIGKYLLHDWVQRNLLDKDQAVIKALSSLIENHPWRYTTLWGFAYIPIWTMTLGLPVLGCPFYVFIIATNLPGVLYTTLFILIGLAAKDAVEEVKNGEDVDPLEITGTVVGIVFLILIVFLMGWFVRKEMKKLEAEELEREQLEGVERSLEDLERRNSEPEVLSVSI